MAKLRPEVELPRPRSNGAALVAVASLAMFTAIGASAFLVRMRMERAQLPFGAPALVDDTPTVEVDDDDYGGDMPPVVDQQRGFNAADDRDAARHEWVNHQLELIAQYKIEGNCTAANSLRADLQVMFNYDVSDVPRCITVTQPPPSVEVRFEPVRQR